MAEYIPEQFRATTEPERVVLRVGRFTYFAVQPHSCGYMMTFKYSWWRRPVTHYFDGNGIVEMAALIVKHFGAKP